MGMTDDEVTLRILVAGMLTGKLTTVGGLKVKQARIEDDGSPPEIDVEIDGCVVTIAVLSAKRPAPDR